MGTKEDTPNVEFILCESWSEAMEERKCVIEDSWRDAEESQLCDLWVPLKPEEVFVRPVILESGNPDFTDAEWVVIELNPSARDEQNTLENFHSYNSLGSVPANILERLHKRSPYFLLASYHGMDVGFTAGAFEMAFPILRNLQIFIAKSK